MFDYQALRAVHAVIQTGSFEKAAATLHVTPSAVSQRVKNLEERLGAVLIVRGNPAEATETGEWLCRHMENVGLLERDLMERLPGLMDRTGPSQPVTLSIATNADSLGTWFMEAVTDFARRETPLLNIAVDDEEHTAEWLERGRVIAAVTSIPRAVAGCRLIALGAFISRATASPDYMARQFPDGVTPEALARAPAVTFNRTDRLQGRWIRHALGLDMSVPTHWLPSTQGFLEASLGGMGWCMNPALLVREHLQSGRLVELLPGSPLDIPLFWQINRLSEARLSSLTEAVRAAAARHLVPSGHAP